MMVAAQDPRCPLVRAVADDLNRIKGALMEEYERGDTVDIAVWTTKYPAYRDELIDFWAWVSGTKRVIELGESEAVDEDGVAREALRQACLAVSLGSQWLEPSVETGAASESELGEALARLRSGVLVQGGRATKSFRRAVVYSWIVDTLGGQRMRVSRLAVQKVSYLIEQALGLDLFTEHGQKPLGPYDHKVRYKDAEPISVRSEWIRVRGAYIERGPKRDQISRYAGRYLRSERLASRLVDVLSVLNDEQLESWATVVWAGRALAADSVPVSAESVRAFLSSSVQWRGKLLRECFSQDAVRQTLRRLSRLRFLDP